MLCCGRSCSDDSDSMSLPIKPVRARKFTQIPSIALTLGTLFLWLVASSAAAHEYWIEPEAFHVKPGAKVALALLVGQNFKGERQPYIAETSERFVAVDGNGPRPIRAVSGDDPAGSVTIADPGLTVIGYHSRKYPLRFDTLAEFERYLRLEGLDRLLDAARKRHTAKGLIFEQYERCAKTLLAGPDISNAPPDRTLGLPLELLAETNPYRLGPDRKLRVRLLYRSQPLAGALVKAFNRTDPSPPLEARTDADGRATFTLARPGAWLVSTVHMTPAPLLSSDDWQSWWASVTFEINK